MAPPQNRIPMPMRMLVTMAGVEWNCVNVYKIIPMETNGNNVRRLACWSAVWRLANERGHLPVKKMGIDIKNPPTAHTRLMLDFCRYLLPLSVKK